MMINTEAAAIAQVLDRTVRAALEQLAELPDEALNRPVPLPETNSLFALGTHLIGAAEFWVLALAGGHTVQRDRPAEFRAEGSGSALTKRYEEWLTAMHTLLDGMSATSLERDVEPPAEYRGSLSGGPMTVRAYLLHAVEHSALHLGHIQITHQMLRAAPSAGG